MLALVLSTIITQSACRSRTSHGTLPTMLSDDEFWRLSTSLSEPAGVFAHSENLVSNEPRFVHMIRVLRASDGVYIGVGPEQNFSYIARLRPSMAFIVDIRQENRNLQLMYKALFEISTDRADFLSRLFSRERPSGLRSRATVQDLFAAYATAKAPRALRDANVRLVRARLLDVHRLPLTSEDLGWIEHVLDAFHAAGPEIHYSSRSDPNDSPGPSYRALMTAPDLGGHSRSYLASDEDFAFVKTLESTNRIVPIVGDFGGPAAIRKLGDYIRQHEGSVTAFYASNVEVYLNRHKLGTFCGNLATLPYSSRTWFIGSKDMQPFSTKLKSCSPAAR
jgi:hypothetical protein